MNISTYTHVCTCTFKFIIETHRIIKKYMNMNIYYIYKLTRLKCLKLKLLKCSLNLIRIFSLISLRQFFGLRLFVLRFRTIRIFVICRTLAGITIAAFIRFRVIDFLLYIAPTLKKIIILI